MGRAASSALRRDWRKKKAAYEGGSGKLLAAKEIHSDKYLVVVYREISEKGKAVPRSRP
jgi:hypothetical protein